MTHVTCRLTAKNRDHLRNPTLDNRVWDTFTFFNQLGDSRWNLCFVHENEPSYVYAWFDVVFLRYSYAAMSDDND